MAMSALEAASCLIRSEADLIDVRTLLRHFSQISGLGPVDQTKFVTAGSELARNIIKYAQRGGKVRVETLAIGERRGLRAIFSDSGPGIDDIKLVMRDGYSSSGSLGIGLPGSRRLVDEFFIESKSGAGTTVTIVTWSRDLPA